MVVRQVQGLAVVGGDRDDLTDRAVGDPPTHLGDVRQVPRPHRLHDEDVVPLGGREDVLDLGAVARQGLLDEDVLARLDRQQRVLAVPRVR